MTPNDCYRILDLEPGATMVEVKRSYRELVKVWHPDRFAQDPVLERKAQEKLKQINLAFELLDGVSDPNEPKIAHADNTKVPTAGEVFLEGYNLFFGEGVAKDKVKAATLLRKSAEMGFPAAQYLLGYIYYSGEGLQQSQVEAAFWWKKAAEQCYAEAQYSLGCLYNNGHEAGLMAKVVKNAVNWDVGDAKIEAFKWLNLAISYGAGRKAGLVKDSVSACLSEKQRNEARVRASKFYPNYPKRSEEEVFDDLISCFLEEVKFPKHSEVRNLYSKLEAEPEGLTKYRNQIREKGLEHLRTTFTGGTLEKTGGFFKAVGSAWGGNRSADDWGRLAGRNIVEFPNGWLSDAFIHKRENAINQVWLILMHRQ